jgi:long-subunit acyl-CoA synthetase (AMP-forming)
MTTHATPTASGYRLILDCIQEHEIQRADQVYLTQPVGQGQVRDYTWRETLDEARRMARHLQSRGFEQGTRIGLISKNCAHFIMAELAIWLSGGTTVALFPTESADNIRFVLEHSETRLLFIGKLDNWARQQSGVPQGLACIALPLSDAPALQPDMPRWENIVANTEGLKGRITRDTKDLALLAYTSGSTGEPKGVMHNFGVDQRAHWQSARTPGFVVPATVTCFRAVKDRLLVFGGWQCAGVFFRIARYFCERPSACTAQLLHFSPQVVAQVPAWRVRQNSGCAARRRTG